MAREGGFECSAGDPSGVNRVRLAICVRAWKWRGAYAAFPACTYPGAKAPEVDKHQHLNMMTSPHAGSYCLLPMIPDLVSKENVRSAGFQVRRRMVAHRLV
jgi:hypothetical protein